MSEHRTSGTVSVCINHNANRVIIASEDAEKVIEIVVKFLEQTPGCRSDDTMVAYRVQKIVRDVKFRHLKFSKLCEFLEKGIEKLSNI